MSLTQFMCVCVCNRQCSTCTCGCSLALSINFACRRRRGKSGAWTSIRTKTLAMLVGSQPFFSELFADHFVKHLMQFYVFPFAAVIRPIFLWQIFTPPYTWFRCGFSSSSYLEYKTLLVGWQNEWWVLWIVCLLFLVRLLRLTENPIRTLLITISGFCTFNECLWGKKKWERFSGAILKTPLRTTHKFWTHYYHTREEREVNN